MIGLGLEHLCGQDAIERMFEMARERIAEQVKPGGDAEASWHSLVPEEFRNDQTKNRNDRLT